MHMVMQQALQHILYKRLVNLFFISCNIYISIIIYIYIGFGAFFTKLCSSFLSLLIIFKDCTLNVLNITLA